MIKLFFKQTKSIPYSKLLNSKPLDKVKNNFFQIKHLSSKIIHDDSSHLNTDKIASHHFCADDKSDFFPKNNYPKVKLSNGKTADYIREDELFDEKSMNELKDALNFVLSEKVVFEENSCPKGKTSKRYNGGILPRWDRRGISNNSE